MKFKFVSEVSEITSLQSQKAQDLNVNSW